MYRDRPELDYDPDAIGALTAKRQAQWDKLQNATFLTRNEKRAAAGYGPVPGGDEDDGGNDDEDGGAKFNPNHDPSNGQFTSGDGGAANNINDPPIKPVYPVETAITVLLGGEAASVARAALAASESDKTPSIESANSLTDHGAVRVGERDISQEDIQTAIQSAQQSGNITTQTGKYDTPQNIYNGSNGVTVVVETSGRNAGKVITTWR